MSRYVTKFKGKDGNVYLVKDAEGRELKADIIHDTASGAIATFSDGADNLPMEMTVGIEPVQDLHGYENPWPAGGSPQIWDEEWEVGGISSADGQNVQQNNIRSKNYIPVTAGLEYYLFITTDISKKAYLFYYDSNKEYIGNSGGYVRGAITIPSGTAFMRFQCNNNYGYSGYGNDIAINYPSTVTTYAPYSNICPISGWTGCNVSRKGKNLFDQDTVYATYKQTDGSFVGSRSNINNVATYIPQCLVGKAMTFSALCCIPSGSGVTNIKVSAVVNGVSHNGNNVIGSAYEKSIVTFTPVSTADYVRITYGSGSGNLQFKDVQLELGSTASSYEAYSGNTYPITFPSEAGTVYGGTLTVNKDGTGTLVVDRASVDLGTLTSSGDTGWKYITNDGTPYFRVNLTGKSSGLNMLCSAYGTSQTTGTGSLADKKIGASANGNRVFLRDSAYTDLNTFIPAMSGVQLVYELATPVTYQLSNLEVIETLKGTNNIWADTGNVSVNYSADTKLYIDKKFTELQALILENINNV